MRTVQVIVATCQIVLDVIRHGFIKITNFNLIIFDECHHAHKDHPMRELMKCFCDKSLKEYMLPRVIGLTGMLTSPSVSPQNVIEDLNQLECTFRSAIATAKGLTAFSEVLDYSTAPKEIRMEYAPPTLTSEAIQFIQKEITDLIEQIKLWPVEKKETLDLKVNRTPSPLKSLINSLKDFVYQMNDFGIYGGSIAGLAMLVDLELKKRECGTSTMRMIIRSIITREFGHNYTRN